MDTWLEVDFSFIFETRPSNMLQKSEFRKLKIHWWDMLCSYVVVYMALQKGVLISIQRASYYSLEFLIKGRTFSWSTAEDLVPSDQEIIWNITPGQAVGLYKIRRDNFMHYWFKVSDYLRFIDGACKQQFDGSYYAGKGGSSDKNGITVPISGPSSLCSSFEVEMEALNFLMNQTNNSPRKQAHVTIFSDSSTQV